MADSDQGSGVANLEQLIARIEDAARTQDQVSIGAIMDRLGNRSFGPVLLLVGLITLAPIVGDIPGVPSLMGLLLLLTTAQLLIGREHLWLPQWLLARSLAHDKVERALDWLRRPARGIDRLLRPRLQMFVQGAGGYAVAVICALIALALPIMEVVPFSANGAGLALTAFGLGLIARDGLLALLAFIVTAATFVAVTYGLI